MQAAAESPATSPMTPLRGLGVLGGIVVIVALFIGLNSVLGFHEIWAAFLFVTYWAGIQHMQMSQFVPAALGAVVAVLAAFLLKQLPLWFGETAALGFLAVVLVMMYANVMGWAPMFVNASTWLFVTVCCAPPIQANFDLVEILKALVVGFAFFAALGWAVSAIATRLATKAAAAAV